MQIIQNDAAAGARLYRPSKSLLIEGWRGINHSFALANQHQILELLKVDGLRLFHRDLPFAFPHWNRVTNASGFSPAELGRIDSLSEDLQEDRVDCVYRISSPFRTGRPGDHRKTVTFMITELGLTQGSFEVGADRSDFFTRDHNCIVTSTEWSRARLVDYGFAPEKVHVIPLGVDTSTFFPMKIEERQAARAVLGIAEDETLFVNVGLATWNKGIDVLLHAFARLRASGRRVRLILKDQRDVYGVSVEQTIRNVGENVPSLLTQETLGAISVISHNMPPAHLRSLYGIADAYVSPYRGEGFNLPVLEAIACRTPVIVTLGGATDDFCNEDVAIRIPGRLGRRDDPSISFAGRFVEPDLDALTDAMDGLSQGRGFASADWDGARARILEKFCWQRSAVELARLTVGLDGLDQTQTPTSAVLPPSVVQAVRSARPVSQSDVLNLIQMIRPLSMMNMGKLRLGNAHDGGYVLPMCAVACDVVVSIGVGSNVSFDLDFANRGARVLQFDHTVERSPVSHPNFLFHRKGWGVETAGDMLDFKTILETLGSLSARKPLLKFDIEGAEYEVLSALAPGRLAAFDVIVCEIHDLTRLADQDFFEAARQSLEILTADHAPVHLHVNNYRGVAMIAGVPVPDVLEIALLRRDLGRFSGLSSDPIPGPLDSPNHPLVSDICMTAF